MELASAVAGWRGDAVKMLVGKSLESGQLISLGVVDCARDIFVNQMATSIVGLLRPVAPAVALRCPVLANELKDGLLNELNDIRTGLGGASCEPFVHFARNIDLIFHTITVAQQAFSGKAPLPSNHRHGTGGT